VANSNGFPLDLPNINDLNSLEAWQSRVVDKLEFVIRQGVTTGSATTAALVSVALDQSTVYLIESWVLGVLNSTTGANVPGLAMMNVFRGGFSLDGSNNAQIVGSGVTKVYSGVNLGETSEPWSASLTVSGSAAVQQVTGNSDDLIFWRGAMKIFQVSL